jgi:hypothetical protein
MRICWFNDNRLGLVEGDRVRDASRALDKLPMPTYPFPPKGDPLIANLDRLKPDIIAAAEAGASFVVDSVKFLSPVSSPTKIIGTPTNYRDHVAEADRQREVFGRRYTGSIEEQGLFLKANSALIGPGEGVRLRFPERRTDHEMELGVVMGRRPPTSARNKRCHTWPAIRSLSTWSCAAPRTAAFANRSTLMPCSVRGWSPRTRSPTRRTSISRSPSTAR